MAAPIDMKLSEMFDKIWTNYDWVENCTDPSNSKAVQDKLEEGIGLAEKAVHMVNDLALFSTNEHIEEVTTNELKYLLLPALLGQLMMRVTPSKERFEVVQKAQVYLIDYIRLLRLYGVTKVDLPKPFNATPTNEAEDESDPSTNQTRGSRSSGGASADLGEAQQRRTAKVERYKRQRALQTELSALHSAIQREHVDEDVKRKYYLKLLDKWLIDTLDSLDTLDAEITLLHHMGGNKGGANGQVGGANGQVGGANGHEGGDKQVGGATGCQSCKHSHSQKPTGVLRPFIVTKDALQRAVYGLGYPSLPTLSVDQFYTQRVEQGIFPDPTLSAAPVVVRDPDERAANESERRDAQRDEREDRGQGEGGEEEEQAVRDARQWDDWRDDHRRGWGNTHNKG